MPKQQSKIQECEKCQQAFAKYYITELCDECYNIKNLVNEFVSKETDNKPITKKE